jgi:hypothetical protein
MAKMWNGYHRARIGGEKIEQMEKYAKAIQNVQKDMGIKTTSFPHLGLYGDVFVLNNRQGERVAFEDHSALAKKQQQEQEQQQQKQQQQEEEDEQEKWEAEQARQAKKIQEKLQKPDIKKGEEIVSFADDVGPSYIEADEEEEEDEETVPDLLERERDEEEGETTITMSDDIPFTCDPWRIRRRRFP